MLKYDIENRKKKGRSERDGFGKGKEMFTVIRSSCSYLENRKNAPLDHKEAWVLGFACSDKNEPEKNTVGRSVGLS